MDAPSVKSILHFFSSRPKSVLQTLILCQKMLTLIYLNLKKYPNKKTPTPQSDETLKQAAQSG